jgi:hypothetical protein
METWAVVNEGQTRSWDGGGEERYERMLTRFTGHLLTSAAPLPLPSPSRGPARCHSAASLQPSDQAGRSKSSAGGMALTST